MIITKATYGGKDCLSYIHSLVVDNRLVVRASNNLVGDPSVGQVKYFVAGCAII